MERSTETEAGWGLGRAPRLRGNPVSMGPTAPHGPAPGFPPTSQDLHFLVLLFLNSRIEVRLAHANPHTVRTYGRAGFEHVRGRKSPPVHPL